MGTVTVSGWSMMGTRRDAYSAERTPEVVEGKPVVRMWRSDGGEDGHGALFQRFKPDAYRGKRVRFSASLRTVGVTGRAAVCMRVDDPDPGSSRPLAFDNMENRPRITGTTDWTRYACVLDVVPGAGAIFISNILFGQGELFWSDLHFEVVDGSVPVTNLLTRSPIADEPTNLDFSAP